MTRTWTRLLSNKNKDISSYMKLQLNNIVVLVSSPQTAYIYLSCYPKTSDPVSLYSVTQLPHICII